MRRRVAFPATAAAAALALVACGAPGAGVPHAPGGFLVKAPSVTPTFPLTATYLPPGVVRPAFLGFDDDMLTARFKIAGTAQDVADNLQGLDIEIGTDPDHLDPRAELTDVMDPGIVTEVQVQGKQAWLSVSRDGPNYTTPTPPPTATTPTPPAKGAGGRSPSASGPAGCVRRRAGSI